MNTISLADLQTKLRARKATLGIVDVPAETEALRNQGTARSEEKRELLRRVERRARIAGRAPVISHY